jgi:hypothetical protein
MQVQGRFMSFYIIRKTFTCNSESKSWTFNFWGAGKQGSKLPLVPHAIEHFVIPSTDNNKQVEYRVKSPNFYITYVFQYYYLNIKILKFHENLNFWNFLKKFEILWKFWLHILRYFCIFRSPVIYWRVNSLKETIARQTIELTFEPFFIGQQISKLQKFQKISKGVLTG